jgi:small-conductance mechanosensitive channel
MKEIIELLPSLAIAAGAIVLGLILNLFVKRLLARWQPKGGEGLARGVETLVAYWKGPLQALIPALCLEFGLCFTDFPTDVTPVLRQILLVWILVTVAWFAVRTVYMAGNVVVAHVGVDGKDNLRARQISTGLKIVQRMIAVAIWFITAGAILMSFSGVRQFGVSILASAGVAGIIIGFAAQRTLGSILAGIQIALAQPIRLDDVVIVEDQWGWIEEINLTYVVVRIWDQRRLVLPITYFIEKPFQNWTRTSAELLGTVMLYADYTAPVEEVRNELKRLLEASPLWNRKVCVLQVTDAKQQTVELRALMSADDSSKLWDLRCLVREGLLDFLQRRHPECLPRVRVEWGPEGGPAKNTGATAGSSTGKEGRG